MITIEGPEGKSGANLATLSTGSMAKPQRAALPLTVGLLERELLKRYPAADAEPWDRTGILVGDPSLPVTGVCVALDPTREAIRATAALGANVLLTHHPAFLDPPHAISPSRDVAGTTGANVYEAVRQGVALMNFHTALDVSDDARTLFMDLLNLDYARMLVASGANPAKGYGYACAVRESDAPFTLARMAARCTSVFGRAPRVWGDSGAKVSTVAFANGSAGDVAGACIDERIDCLICGEIRYHAALDASQEGLSIVELGHDASELPLTALLARAALDAGVAPEAVHVLDQQRNWSVPDSTRLGDSAVE